MLALDDVRAFRGRSVGPTFKADLRKSLFAHFEPVALVVCGDIDDAGVDVLDVADMTLVGDSNFGGCGGNALFEYSFCFVGEVDELFGDCVGATDGGLFDFDFESLFDALLIELLREIDGDFDIELSRDDFDGVFSLSMLFSGEFSFESFSLFEVRSLYFDIEAKFELPVLL